MPLPEHSKQAIESAITQILVALGLDLSKPNYIDTPARVAKMYDDVLDGAFTQPDEPTTFKGIEYDGMVVVHHTPFYSWCAHHLVPMYGTFAMGYVPNERLLGLSKLVRLFRHGCKIPTTQEEITQKAVNLVQRIAEPKGVMCYVEAEHMCMTLRGVKSPGSMTSTLRWSGIFDDDKELRDQFLTLATMSR